MAVVGRHSERETERGVAAPRLRSRFTMAGASLVGPAHHRVRRNNQDAWSAWLGDDLAVFAVADGCSSGRSSEVGAQLAARWIVAQAARRWSPERTSRHEALACELFDGLSQYLGSLAEALAPEPKEIPDVIADLLLATMIVAFVDHELVSVFGIGDGLVILDGAPVVIACNQQTGPDYLAYRLLGRADTGRDPGSIVPRLLATASTDTLRELVLATDGAHDLLAAKAGRDRIGPLFEDGQIARRPALLEARLEALASEPGLLHDDVTLVALLANRPPRAERPAMSVIPSDGLGAAFIVRRASADDYPAFARLFPELLVDDPVPSLDTWSSVLAPSTWIAARDGEVLGYCFFQEYADTGYVRNVVVSPNARRGGVGRALMHATAEHLRSRGKGSWRLNVKPSNQAALALYERMGMRAKYSAKSLRLPWAASRALPAGSAVIRDLTPDRDAALESLFDLPRGQLAAARGLQRILLEAISSDGRSSVGLAVFDPKFPGAFPFRVTELGAVAPLLTAMHQHVPMDEHVNLVAEDDERLADLLGSVGARLRDEILHMEGVL